MHVFADVASNWPHVSGASCVSFLQKEPKSCFLSGESSLLDSLRKKQIPPWTDPTRDSHPSLPQLAEPFSPSPVAVGVAPPSPASSSTRTETNVAVIIDSDEPRRPWGLGHRRLSSPDGGRSRGSRTRLGPGTRGGREIENAGAGISP
jgi:hypothetical protein